MKKLCLLVTLFTLSAGCSNRAEMATESGTAAVNPQKNDTDAWLEQMRSDTFIRKSILDALNDVSVNHDMADSLSALCDDNAVNRALQNRAYKPVIVQNGRDDTQEALNIIRNASNTGAQFVPNHIDEIERIAAARANQNHPAPFEWTDDDIKALRASLPMSGFDPKSENAADAFVTLLQGEQCPKILPRYCEYAANTKELLKSSAGDDAKLDVMLTCELTKYAGEMRLNYPQNDYKFDRFRKYISDKAITDVRKEVFIQDMAKRGAAAAFKSIAPPHPQYQALIDARRIYLDAIEAGGWPQVTTPAKITDPIIGKSYPYVPVLRKRLAAENYSVQDSGSDIFDQPLLDAVNLYRELHQLNSKKSIDAVFFKNLAVSPQERLETIDLAIQKYRESPVGSLNYYLMINIPDFYVDVWKDGKIDRRHRIVVGNDKLQRDPVTKQIMPDPETLYPYHPNRTPIQTSKINEIILNPYWNVPERIRKEELEPKLIENPNYYAENNYEEVNKDNPKLYYVRELPNPKNSLGKVKFMFPNPHNTYLHDTPAKAVFKSPVRAFSHGCMRTQDPLDLAKYMLQNDGQWDEREYNKIMNANPPEQVSIMLNHPVDVVVVYINARRDERGPTAFLSDIYQYDAVRTGKVVLKKLPKPKDWKQ